MKKIFLYLLLLLINFPLINAQIRGEIKKTDGGKLSYVQIYDKAYKTVAESDEKGQFYLKKSVVEKNDVLMFFLEGYKLSKFNIPTSNSEIWTVILEPLSVNLSQVVVLEYKKNLYNFRHLQDVEDMTINAGKKSEVVKLSDMLVNKATNNARQIFAKVVGLTVNEGSDGGLQLSIGGRGLNPNRTANFNTRQNGYDISADVLGYPETYYTPASEGIDEIQVVRGAAGLQYGTQFGGMVNFMMKKPANASLQLTERVSVGSYGLFSSFTEFSGRKNKIGYYGFYNFKRGNGYRPNSKYNQHNAFLNLRYKIDDKNTLSFDVVKFYYLAQQPGGLTDFMFYENPAQSNRTRNWFRVDWNIFNLKYQHLFDEDARFSIQLFKLNASRSALGRIRGKRVSEIDVLGTNRDLLIGKFDNWGSEIRFLKNYQFKTKKHTLLVGGKYYQSENESRQGAGSSGSDANFDFATKEFPFYERQSSFKYPNLNLAFFAENIFNITENTTITPGLRIEKIRTESDGNYRVIFSHAGKIFSDTTMYDRVIKDRNVFLLGLGLAHKTKTMEWYANISQNYRSITFSDIHSDVLGLAISPNITDEKGFSSDIGFRGTYKEFLNFDTGIYALLYGNKIGEYWHVNKAGGVERYRDNVGDALTYGFETMINWDVNKTFMKKSELRLHLFINTSFTGSKYIKSDVPNVQGNEVEFVPLVNLKSGINIGYKNFLSNFQFTFVSSQFTDATNKVVLKTDNTTGIFGAIPAYYVFDLSASYRLNKYIRIEGSLQNLTNKQYFTRRATGYPGPGIIPSEPINGVLTLILQLK